MVKKKKVARSRGEEGIKVEPELDEVQGEEETDEVLEVEVVESELKVSSVLQLIKILDTPSVPNTVVTYIRKDTEEIICVVTSDSDTNTLTVIPSEWASDIATQVWDEYNGQGIDPHLLNDSIDTDGWAFIFKVTLGMY